MGQKPGSQAFAGGREEGGRDQLVHECRGVECQGRDGGQSGHQGSLAPFYEVLLSQYSDHSSQDEIIKLAILSNPQKTSSRNPVWYLCKTGTRRLILLFC